MGEHEGSWAKDCSSACALSSPRLAQAEALAVKLSYKFNQVQKRQFFQPNTLTGSAWSHVPRVRPLKVGLCFLPGPCLLYFGCSAAFSQQIGAPSSLHG